MGNKSLRNMKMLEIGAEYEKKLNAAIQKRLNDTRLINRTNSEIQEHVKNLKSLRKLSELAAHQMNIATKDDLARIANLSMQLEEKVDQVEELLYEFLGEKQSEKDKKQTVKKKDTQIKKQSNDSKEAEKQEMMKEQSVKKGGGKFFTTLASICANEFLRSVENALQTGTKKRG